MYSNHKHLVRVVKELLRSTGSVDKTVSHIVREVVKSVKSNDNVSMILIVFNQFGVTTAHAGALQLASHHWHNPAPQPFTQTPPARHYVNMIQCGCNCLLLCEHICKRGVTEFIMCC